MPSTAGMGRGGKGAGNSWEVALGAGRLWVGVGDDEQWQVTAGAGR